MLRKFENIFSMIIKLLAFSSVILLGLVILFILKESLVVFKEISFFKFVTEDVWKPLSSNPKISILPMILATVYLSFIAVLIALPVGIGCALFLCFNLKKNIGEIAKSFIDILAGIPSVIYGFIGLLILVKLFETHLSLSSGESILAGGIVLSLMILPYIISLCYESFTTINEKYSASSKVLGISKWHMVRFIVLPSAQKSILAGGILALGRAMGETMAVMMVIGNAPIMPKLLGKGQTISSLIALEMGSTEVGSLHYHGLFAAGFILMILLIVLNTFFYFLKKNISY